MLYLAVDNNLYKPKDDEVVVAFEGIDEITMVYGNGKTETIKKTGGYSAAV